MHVTRSEATPVGGYTWTISFLDDVSHVHRGDLPDINVISSLAGGSGKMPMVVVKELRKGTWKEVQQISITAGGSMVHPASTFRLRFKGESTNDILALPLGGATCLGSTRAKQIITTTTEDTSNVGGDSAVSPLTSFTLTYGGQTTSKIGANNVSCSDAALKIELELEKLPLLHDISVSGSESNQNDDGCIWVVTFESVMGNPELLKGKFIFAYFQY